VSTELEGLWHIREAADLQGKPYTGTFTLIRNGGMYTCTGDTSAGLFTGIGLWMNNNLCVAWGPGAGYGIAIYDLPKHSVMRGVFTAAEYDGRMGEELIRGLGLESLQGQFKVSGNRPDENGKSYYDGNVAITPQGKVLEFQWDVLPGNYSGIGIATPQNIAVAWGRYQYGIGVYEVVGDGLKGVWANPGVPHLGYENLTR